MKKLVKTVTSIVLVLALALGIASYSGIFDAGAIEASELKNEKLISTAKTKTETKKSKDASTVTGKVMKLTKKTKATDEEMISGYNDFAMKTLRETVLGEEKGTNVMISPASLMFALDMAAMGANGKTYSQMASLIRKGATKRDLVNFAKEYRQSLENSGMVNVANSIWINETCLKKNNIRVSEKYLNLIRKAYQAAAASRVFNDETKDEINAWILKHTNGMIKEGVSRLTDENLMLIINAIAFEGKWASEYTESQVDENGEFTNYLGEKEKAKMLSSTEGTYLSSDVAKGFLKYYEDDKFAFMAMLPLDESVSITDFVGSLSDDALEKFFESRQREKVITKTPAFSFDYSTTMNDMLKKLGMKNAFAKNADFFSMLDPETVNPDLLLYISSVIQKTHIELDEKGTKAAAVTIISMNATTTSVKPVEIPKEVILDRPFVFAIMDVETGTPVFAGVVNTVK